jgi:hypothetical protein
MVRLFGCVIPPMDPTVKYCDPVSSWQLVNFSRFNHIVA